MRRGAPDAADVSNMEAALQEARRGAAQGEVPVGAVIVRAGVVVARAHNQMVARRDPTAHAELLAIREALKTVGTDRLTDASLYVTLEPCAMCAGASVLAKVGRMVYGAHDEKSGMCGSLGDVARHPRLNHRVEVVAGVLAEESAALLTAFFRERRSPPG